MQQHSKITAYLSDIQTPSYVLEEHLLENNLRLLDHVQQQSGAKILCALKGFAFWHSFDLVGNYLYGGCASGLNEAKLAHEKIAKEVHTYSPAFKESEIDEVADISDHIIFNSFNQLIAFKERVKTECSIGLRINPEYSSAPTQIYNPCAPFSRLGIVKSAFREDLLEDVEGLHFHALCEESAQALDEVLDAFEKNFAQYIGQMRWINFGGGHHITKEGYDVDHLIRIIRAFKAKYDVEVYLEPGEAVGWQCGSLVASVIDIIHNGMDIAILDTSAEAHMPDTLAMPYRPDIRGAGEHDAYPHRYLLGGNSCLAGDIIGDYSFKKPLQIGDKIILEDMLHYTTVKNTTFNGIALPSLSKIDRDGNYKVVASFGYDEYKRRN
jgi:carboxynorspermidine decarboxylase